MPGTVVAVVIALVVAVLVMMGYLDLAELAITSAVAYILISLWMKLKELDRGAASDVMISPPELQWKSDTSAMSQSEAIEADFVYFSR